MLLMAYGTFYVLRCHSGFMKTIEVGEFLFSFVLLVCGVFSSFNHSFVFGHLNIFIAYKFNSFCLKIN